MKKKEKNTKTKTDVTLYHQTRKELVYPLHNRKCKF